MTLRDAWLFMAFGCACGLLWIAFEAPFTPGNAGMLMILSFGLLVSVLRLARRP